jgi:hypothetical protein
LVEVRKASTIQVKLALSKWQQMHPVQEHPDDLEQRESADSKHDRADDRRLEKNQNFSRSSGRGFPVFHQQR